jgi:amino acid transporter
MLFAFARDGGLGRGKALAAVSPRFRTPHRAVWISVAMAFVVALWGGSNSVVVAMSTIALYASYGLPILLALRAARRGRLVRGPFSLGAASLWIGRAAVAWVAILTILFVLPPNQRVGYTFAGCLVPLALHWGLVARKRFEGPAIARREAAEGHGA